MNNRELMLKKIITKFTEWEVRLSNLISLNLYDANLFSENLILDLLNEIFDYQLINANFLKKNYPSIDLLDNHNRVAVQVTASKTKSKIQTTLNKFFEKKLDQKFDELLIIILGKKLKSYSNLKLNNKFDFYEDKHIIDFRDLLVLINSLPTDRIEKIALLLEQETIQQKKKESLSNASRIKRNLSLKRKMKKDFFREIPSKDIRYAIYIPSHRLKYDNVIIRSVDDKTWPNTEENNGKISSWFKGQLWDFYDNGIELVSNGGYAIFDEKGNWDILNWEDDNRGNNPKYKKIGYSYFLKIPYDYIIDYDIEPDDYFGVPTIYVEYAKNGMPYEEILYGILGSYDNDNESNSKLTYYFDNSKRIKLK